VKGSSLSRVPWCMPKQQRRRANQNWVGTKSALVVEFESELQLASIDGSAGDSSEVRHSAVRPVAEDRMLNRFEGFRANCSLVTSPWLGKTFVRPKSDSSSPRAD